MNRNHFAVTLIAWMMLVCLAESALASASWYIVKDTGNEGIKYFKDEQGGYSSGGWTEAQTTGTLSGLLNGGEVLSGDTVYISQGTYSLDASLSINKTITIYGGFSGSSSDHTLDDRKNSNAPVILSGQDTHQVIAISANATLDSLTLTHGKGTDGGAVSITTGTPTISITNCAITNSSATESGGGLVVKSGFLTLTNCTIENNSASIGGGIYTGVKDTSVTLTNCSITNNKAKEEGGGIYQLLNTLTLKNCTIAHNLNASTGLELRNYKGTTSITNSLVWNQNTDNTVKLTISGGSINYTNCVLPASLDQWTNPTSSSATVNGVTHTVFTLADNPDLLVLMDAGTPEEAPSTDILGKPRFDPPTIGSLEYPFDTGYDVSTPDGLSIYGIGWNTQGTITAKNAPSVAGKLFHPLKKVKVTASSANGWKLKDTSFWGLLNSDTVSYTLKSDQSGPETTTWEFSADEINAEGGTSKVVGADVEDFTTKRPGAYDDTVTYTVTIEDR